jgi:hypothetical protein
MRYPTLNLGQTDVLVRQLLREEETSAFTVALWKGHGEAIDFEDLEEIIEEFQSLLIEYRKDQTLSNDKDWFEGRLAESLFPFFDSVPIELLDDAGFWRYLCVHYFWWFVSWREAGPLANGNAAAYTNAAQNTEQIPLRLYLRAKAVRRGDDVSPSAQLRQSSDFWRSHVLRVRTGTAPEITRALVEMQKDDDRHLPTDAMRAYARRLNRIWTNVDLNLLNQVEARRLIEELRD